MTVPTNVHHHTVRDCADCPVAVGRRHGTARVLSGRRLEAPGRVLAEQVPPLLIAPFRPPAQDMAKPLAIGMNRPSADGFAFAVHYGRPISTDGSTARSEEHTSELQS